MFSKLSPVSIISKLKKVDFTPKKSILEKEISKNKYLRNRVIGNKKARTNVYKILFSFHFQVDNE